jgi:uncharacterized membrane protein YfcA
MSQVLELLGVGLIVGLAGGTLGVGGGFILVPVLYTVLGWPLVSAVATSHFCGMAVSTSASGNYAGAGLIDWRLGVIMEVAAVVGSATGAYLMKWISTPVVAVLFCAVVALAAVRMWQPQKQAADSQHPQERARAYAIGLPVMYLVGVAAGILGLGGGVLIVPILTVLMATPTRSAVATSAFMVGLNGAAAAVVYYLRGNVAVVPTGILAVTVMGGARLGSSLQHHLPVTLLRRLFAILLVALAIRLLLQAIKA